jgi:hypothetical protein
MSQYYLLFGLFLPACRSSSNNLVLRSSAAVHRLSSCSQAARKTSNSNKLFSCLVIMVPGRRTVAFAADVLLETVLHKTCRDNERVFSSDSL